MIEESLTLKKYTYKGKDDDYIIYVFPDEHNCTSFYIQRKQYGIISHAIGVDLQRMRRTAEGFIEDNIEEWIEDYKSDIDRFERV